MFCYVNDVTNSIFMNGLLSVTWLIIVFGSFFIQKISTGSGDLPVSMSLGSFTLFVFAVLLRLVSCPYLPLVSDMALGVIIGINLLSVLFLFFSRD